MVPHRVRCPEPVYGGLQLSLGDILLDSKVIKTGFRHVELVQDHLDSSPLNPVSGGRSFYFEINHIPIFVGGSNWIPADSFLPRISR